MKLTPKQQEIQNRFGISSPEGFLSLFPSKYEFRLPLPKNQWTIGQTVLCEAIIASAPTRIRFKGKQSLIRFEAQVEETHFIITVFNQPFLKIGSIGETVSVFGVYDALNTIRATIVSSKPLDTLTGIFPIYPLKQGIKNYEMTRILNKVLALPHPECTLPEELSRQHMPLADAFKEIHQPQSKENLSHAIQSIKYTEFMRYFYLMSKTNAHGGVSRNVDVSKIIQASESLPFDLTEEQKTAVNEIVADLKSSKPMHRLLQGDVGSGKTIVALLSVFGLKGQTAFCAPTEILALQHYQTAKALFHEKVILLTKETSKDPEVLKAIREGDVDLIVGTHALFQESVTYHDLVCVIFDEQHRFGVAQRNALFNKGTHVERLMLSATPIPRTLAASLYFDIQATDLPTRDIRSEIVKTKIIHENSFRSILDEMTSALEAGSQIFVVCPAIDQEPGLRGVIEITKQCQRLFPNVAIDMLHGALLFDEKAAVMARVSSNQTQICVATSIIEVGVNAPKARMMIIYNAERFGLATLHQLRGRIGRYGEASDCYLLSDSTNEDALARLQALVDEHDGYSLSLLDLKLRGSGDLLGVRQSGIPEFLSGDIIEDQTLIAQVKQDLKTFTATDELEQFFNCASYYYGWNSV